MLTLAELQAATINREVAQEAHAQAEKRLSDALTTKDSHERKAFALLAACVTVALALFTAFGVFASGPNHIIAPPFLVAAMVYSVAAILCGIALLPQNYGALGSDPSAWLRPGVIDGTDAALPATLAYETFFHQERIGTSERSNRCKARLIRAAILAGLAALLVLGTWIWWLS